LLVLSLIFPCSAFVFDLWVNIFMNEASFRKLSHAEKTLYSKILIPCQTLLYPRAGELADGFRTRERAFEETPPTRQVCNVCKGVVRECWLQNRNETCHSAFGDDAFVVEYAG